MRRTLVVTAVLALLATAAQANEGVVELSVRSKMSAAAASVVATMPTRQAEAPFAASIARDPLPELMLREELDRRTPRGECNVSATTLCYDLAEGRVVYRAARSYMPKFDGLKPEAVSLRHNSVVLKYTFR